MADLRFRRGSNLIEEEMDRLKRIEREIQHEVNRERYEEKKQKRSRTKRSGSQDSSRRIGSYDIAQELEEERERKRQMAKELKIRERQIERTSELLERQSKMLANLEANVMGQNQCSMYNNHQLTTSVYHQSIHTDYQYSQQYPPMNSLVAPNYQYNDYNQPNATVDMYYNPPPLPVTGIIEEPAVKKAKTETGVSPTEINKTDADLKRKNPELKCTYDKCRKTGHEITDCKLLKERSLFATCFYCKIEGHRMEQCPKLGKKQEKLKVMVCFNCSTPGHHRKDCPAKKQNKLKVMVCFNCNTQGHHCKDCPGKKQEKLKGMVCFNCSTPGHHRKDCPEMTESMKCFRCKSEEHKVQNCPQLKKSKETVGPSGLYQVNPEMTESMDNVKNTAVTSSTLNNITLSKLLSIACCAKPLKSSSAPAVASSATKKCARRRRLRKRCATISVNNQALTTSAFPNISSGSADSTCTKAINIVQNTGTKTINPCSVSSNVAAKYTSTGIITSNPSSVSNTNCVTSKIKTVTSSAANPVKIDTHLDIAEEMEKFKNNPKHMISIAKYRCHILNLRKAESEKNKSTVQAQATEKVDSFGCKVSDKKENISSIQNSNSEQAKDDNTTQIPSPIKESIKEEENTESIGMTCDVCQFNCKIQSEINIHNQTPLHIKKAKLCETGCIMCGRVKFKTFTEYTNHKSEKLHQTLLLKKGQISSSRLAKIANKVAGVEYVVPVSGFFCKLCKKFYNEESYAKDDHCRSKEHHEKIGEVLSAKYETAIRAKVLQLYKKVKSNINEKKAPVRFFEVLSLADFTNLKPLASTKSPVKDKPKSKEIPPTVIKNPESSLSVSKEPCVTEVLKETVKEVKTNDTSEASDASDSVSKIWKESFIISSSENDSDTETAKCKDISKASDIHIKNDHSTTDGKNTMKSSGAESGNNYDRDKDAIKSKHEDVDAVLDRPLGKDPGTQLLNSASTYLSGTKQDNMDDLDETKSKCQEIKVLSESVKTYQDVDDPLVKTAAMQYYKTEYDEDSSDTVVYDVRELEQMETDDGPLIKIDVNDSTMAIDPKNNLEIKNVTSFKSLNVNFDQSSFQLKSSDLQESDRVLETGGSTIATPESSSSTPASLTTKKKPQNPTVPSEKIESTDSDTDLLLSEDDETNLSGECDSDIELSD